MKNTVENKAMKAMKVVMLVFAVAALIDFGAASTRAEEEGALEKSTEGADLPDSIAFDSFLELVHPRNETDYVLTTVAEAFGYRLDDPSGKARANARSAALEKTYHALKREKKIAAHEALCSESPASRSVDELFYASNAMDDVENNAAKKYLLIVLSSLTAEERSAFLAYLDNLKQSISYTRIDNRTLYGPGQESMIRIAIERTCAELEYSIGQMGVVQ